MTRRGVRGGALQAVACTLVGLLVGAVIGAVVYALLIAPSLGASHASLAGRTTVAEDELDLALGSYTLGDERVEVSVREAIEQSSSLDAMRNEDGTYELPNADEVLAIARNRILVADAEAKGFEASDEDALAYAQETFGTQDVSLLSANYGMDAAHTREQLRQGALLKKLRDSVVDVALPAAPEPPAAPEAGLEDVLSPDYANYLIGLAGDEWNADANSWLRDDGPYGERLRDYTVSNEGATYSAAQVAYEVAYAQYASAQRKASSEWTAYVNGLLSQATVELSTLVA